MASRKRNQTKQSKKIGNRIHRLLIAHKQAAALLIVVVVFGITGVVWYLQQSNAATTDIDTTNQTSVNNAYWDAWMSASGRYSGWTGSVVGCKAGAISDAARTAHNRAVNFARRLNKLTPVTGALSDTTRLNVQKAALIMDANEKLSHNPDSNWKCYTQAGDTTAARSNLYFSTVSTTVERVIRGYLDDGGASNTAVGHRRWLLNPDAAVFAYGMTNRASAIQVIGLPTDSTNANPAWVSWPSPNWFPATIAPARWSLSSGNNNTIFKYATVTVTHNGATVPITKHSVVDGYAKPTLVWDLPSGYEREGTYTVTVKNIKRSGTTTIYERQYQVKFFQPVKP